MIKRFVDRKIKELGFEKTEDSLFGVTYEKENLEYKYTHCVYILHKNSGKHIVQSYEKECRKDTSGDYFNSVVGLEFKEMFWFWLRSVITFR